MKRSNLRHSFALALLFALVGAFYHVSFTRGPRSHGLTARGSTVSRRRRFRVPVPPEMIVLAVRWYLRFGCRPPLSASCRRPLVRRRDP